MVVKIGSNIASQKAQSQLGKTSSELSTVFERLSSGMRINKASDDAAGLSIAETLRSDQRVFNQGIRNFNDGLSLLNIVDGAVESLSNITIRLKELAEQSSNGTYTARQRTALDTEAQALSKEYTRIIHSTKFNGVQLLNGSLGNGVRLQGGYGVNGSIFSSIGGAIGTGSFAPSQSFSVGSSTSEIQSGDFNGDGILDLATADYAASRLSVFIGNGGGSYKSAVTYTVGGAVRSLITGDVNGDGILDLISGESSGSISILKGNGDGTFQARTTLAGGSFVVSVRAGDFNGDGHLDIASSTVTQGMSIFLGNGNGGFGARIQDTFAISNSMEVGDFNGDGIADIVGGTYTGSQISLLLGRGNGTFQASTLNVGSQPLGVKTGDFNGDGKLDIVAGNYNDDSISILLGNGNGTFQSQAVIQSAGDGPFFVQTGDFNGDGITDLTSVSYIDDRLSTFIGKGDGTFETRVSYSIETQSRTIHVTDLNGDGVQDIAVGSNTSGFSMLIGSVKDGASPLLSFDLKTSASARQALSAFNSKLSQLTSQRSKIGAFQSRIETGINNLRSASENYASAEGRIRNVDLAEESARMVRLSILQKAASAVLAQANLQPEIALTLLK